MSIRPTHAMLLGFLLSVSPWLDRVTAQGSAASVAIIPGEVHLLAGQHGDAFATVYDKDGEIVVNAPITWVAADSSVARVIVDPRTPEVVSIVGVSAGVTVVEAVSGSIKGTATIRVVAAAAIAAPQSVARPAPAVPAAAPTVMAARTAMGRVVRTFLDAANRGDLPGMARVWGPTRHGTVPSVPNGIQERRLKVIATYLKHDSASIVKEDPQALTVSVRLVRGSTAAVVPFTLLRRPAGALLVKEVDLRPASQAFLGH